MAAGSLSTDMLALVNKARQQQGVPLLQFSQELEDAAQQKSDEMAAGTVRFSILRGRQDLKGQAGASFARLRKACRKHQWCCCHWDPPGVPQSAQRANGLAKPWPEAGNNYSCP